MTFDEMQIIQNALCTGQAAVEILGEMQRQRRGEDKNPKQNWADELQEALDILRAARLKQWHKEVFGGDIA